MERNSSLRLVDVVIGLLQRDRITEAFDCLLVAISFAAEHDMETEDAMRMTLDEMAEKSASEPQEVPYVPQVEGWDNVFYGEAALRKGER